MNYELKGNVPFPIALLHLDRGDSAQIEAGSMIYHNDGVTLEGHMNSNGKSGLGGMLSALGRSMTSGESFFLLQRRPRRLAVQNWQSPRATQG